MGREKQEILKFKLVILGGATVGKSALTMRFLRDYFVEKYEPSNGKPYKKLVEIDSETYKFKIVEGNENSNSQLDQYIKTGEGFLLVFDVCNSKPFEEISYFMDKISRIKKRVDVPMVLLGNKYDLQNRQVDFKAAVGFAKLHGIPLIGTSAKTGLGVDKAFHTLIRNIRKKKETNTSGK